MAIGEEKSTPSSSTTTTKKRNRKEESKLKGTRAYNWDREKWIDETVE
jgi:hypothetical protein